MTKSFPLITVGITCFNAQDTIAYAIESALDQNYPKTEILIVDDFSSDESVEIINSFLQHSNVVLKKHAKNLGVAQARNTIIDHAQGEFIVFFDDDDVSLPERIRIQYEKIINYELENSTDLLACWASGCKKYDNGYKAPFKAIGSQGKVPIGIDVVKAQLCMGKNKNVFFGSGTPSCSMMVRKKVYDQIGLYDINMKRIEDTDFSIRLGLAGGHFIGCSEELVIQTSSIGYDKRSIVGYESEKYLLHKYKNRFTNQKKYLYAQEWIKLRYHHFGQERIKSILQLAKLFILYPKWTWEQFWRSAPKRLAHEKRMAKSAS